MFWIFRRRPPLPTPAFVLECAAGVMRARHKCVGKSCDDWGRVDAIGALRIGAFGKARLGDKELSKIDRKPDRWDLYTEARSILLAYLIANNPSFLGMAVESTAVSSKIAEWSDRTPEHIVIETLEKAAKEARHKSVASVTHPYSHLGRFDKMCHRRIDGKECRRGASHPIHTRFVKSEAQQGV